MATLEEQETIISASRTDDYVSIYTSNIHDLAYFRKDARYELVREWHAADTGEIEAAEFRIPQNRANIRKIAKREVSDEQREAAAARMAQNRSLGLL